MAGVFGHGTILEIGSNAVAELTNITGPSLSADAIDVTSHDNADKYREFVAGLKDAGEVSMEGNFISAAQGNVVKAAFDSGDEEVIKITFPATLPIVFTCQGFVTGFEPGAPHDDKLSFSATIKITGKPTLA